MSSDRLLQAAKNLEAQGRLLDAAAYYERAGDLESAARVLATAGHPGRAAELLHSAIQAQPKSEDEIELNRRFARTAAIYYGRAGKTQRAVELLLAIGDRLRAANLLERSGDRVGAERLRQGKVKTGRRNRDSTGRGMSKGALLEEAGKLEAAYEAYLLDGEHARAGRILHKMGRYDQAAAVLAEGRMHYQAARAYASAKKLESAYAECMNVSDSHDTYRRTAVLAIKLAKHLQRFDLEIDSFLTPFLRTLPTNGDELNAQYFVASLYQQNEMFARAKQVLEGVEKIRPGYKDVETRLAALRARLGDSPTGDAFANKSKLPSLPPLADPSSLPSFPAAPRPAAVPAADAPVEGTGGPVDGATIAEPRVPAPVPEGLPSLDAGNLAEGSLVDGRYEIVREIGRGGMGAVYAAFDRELDEQIALKFCIAGDDSDVLDRFKRELALSRRLSHPNVVQVFDIGSWGDGKFMSMELMNGEDLGDKIRRGGLDFTKAYHYLAQCADGLHCAHEKGVIHRDVKPDNFFVTEGDTVKVMDFGIAKKSASPKLTQTGMMAGTPHYIAPEQIHDFSGVTPRADIYALGIIAYQLFTGRVPFDGEELMHILYAHVHTMPTPPSQLNGSITPELEAMILAMMAKDPNDRPETASIVAAWFRERFEASERARRILEGGQ